MPLPKDIQFITFDCYGTLIDWETGVYEAFQKEADRDGFTIDRDVLVPRFIEIQRKIQSGSYELYAEVLRRTAVQVAEELEWGLESSRSQFLPDSVPYWQPFRETNAQLERFAGPGPFQGVRAADRQAEEELGPHRLRLPDRRRAVPEVEDPRDLGQPSR